MHLYRKGHFWFNLTVYGGLGLILLYMGGYAALHRVSDHAALALSADAALQGTGRKLDFSTDIGRRLFPRPTIILKQVQLSEANHPEAALTAGEVHIGIGWSSLLDTPEIEKMVVEGANANLTRRDDGSWNINDLLNRHATNPNSIRINRIQINNSSAAMNAAGQTVRLQNIQFTLSREDAVHSPYTLYAEALHPAWEKLVLQAAGNLSAGNGTLRLPDLQVDFQGQEHSHSFSGSLKSYLRWQSEELQLRNSSLSLNSNRFNSTLTIRAEQLANQGKSVSLSGISAVLNAHDPNRSYNATLNSAQALWRNGALNSDELSLKLGIQPHGSSSLNIAVDGGGRWQPETGLHLPAFKLTTRQDNAGSPRFVSEWDGSLTLADAAHWQLQADGLFERQPAALVLGRVKQQLQGKATLAKFNAAGYTDLLKSSSGSGYPAWFADGLKLNMDVAVNELVFPDLEIHALTTTVKADSEQTVFSPLSANLYSGHSSGSFSITNESPVRYRLQQQAENVQILPLLQDIFGIRTLSGKGRAELDLTTSGSSRQELMSHLSGSLKLRVQDGLWHGINVSDLAKSIFTNTPPAAVGGEQQTPFSEFIIDSQINKGISSNTMRSIITAPAATMTGQGETNFASGQMREDIMIIGQDQTTPLPLRLSGSIDSTTITIDYQKITSGLGSSEEKKKAVSDTLKQQWDWLRR